MRLRLPVSARAIAVATGAGIVLGAFGATARSIGTNLVDPLLDQYVMPALIENFGEPQGLYIRAMNNEEETPQLFKTYLYTGFDGARHGIFVEVKKTGTAKVFHVDEHLSGNLSHFEYKGVAGGAHGQGDFWLQASDTEHRVGVLQGLDRWKPEETCTLHNFVAVLGPWKVASGFPQIEQTRRSEAAALAPTLDKVRKMHSEVAACGNQPAQHQT